MAKLELVCTDMAKITKISTTYYLQEDKMAMVN